MPVIIGKRASPLLGTRKVWKVPTVFMCGKLLTYNYAQNFLQRYRAVLMQINSQLEKKACQNGIVSINVLDFENISAPVIHKLRKHKHIISALHFVTFNLVRTLLSIILPSFQYFHFDFVLLSLTKYSSSNKEQYPYFSLQRTVGFFGFTYTTILARFSRVFGLIYLKRLH